MDRVIRTVWVSPPIRTQGGHACNYVSWFEGEELKPSSARGVGNAPEAAALSLKRAQEAIDAAVQKAGTW